MKIHALLVPPIAVMALLLPLPGGAVLYLLFAPEKTLDLDRVVFNTEAHPLRKTW